LGSREKFGGRGGYPGLKNGGGALKAGRGIPYGKDSGSSIAPRSGVTANVSKREKYK